MEAFDIGKYGVTVGQVVVVILVLTLVVGFILVKLSRG